MEPPVDLERLVETPPAAARVLDVLAQRPLGDLVVEPGRVREDAVDHLLRLVPAQLAQALL
eukprot:2312911-Pyramimonas_sp.AAC.1